MPVAQRPIEYYVTAPLLWPLLLGLRVLGLDVDALSREADLSIESLRDPDTRVPMERALVLMRAAAKASGGTDLGLRLSRLYEPGVFGVLDHLARSSRNLREAIGVLCLYERIHQNAMVTSLREQEGIATIEHRMVHPYAVPREVSDNTLANLVVIGRRWTGVDFTPIEVRIAQPPPECEEPYSHLFRCAVRWNAPSDALVLPGSVMDLPLLMSNAGLSEVLDRYVQDLLAKLSTPQSFGDKVRACICALMPRGDTSLAKVARELQMGPRTLQRRLREEQTSHESLLAKLRRELCVKYLCHDQMSIEDVGLTLGFSDSRAFRRAFKRWTGMTPSELRAGHGASPQPGRRPRSGRAP